MLTGIAIRGVRPYIAVITTYSHGRPWDLIGREDSEGPTSESSVNGMRKTHGQHLLSIQADTRLVYSTLDANTPEDPATSHGSRVRGVKPRARAARAACDNRGDDRPSRRPGR